MALFPDSFRTRLAEKKAAGGSLVTMWTTKTPILLKNTPRSEQPPGSIDKPAHSRYNKAPSPARHALPIQPVLLRSMAGPSSG